MKKPHLPITIFTCIALSLSLATTAQPDDAGKQGIRDVQQVLKDCGFNPGQIDGIWGNRTTTAAKSFLQAHGQLSASDSTTILMAQVDSYRIGDDGPCPDKVVDATDQTQEETGKPGKPVEAMVEATDQGQEGETKNPTEQIKMQIKNIANKEVRSQGEVRPGIELDEGYLPEGDYSHIDALQKTEITFQEDLMIIKLERSSVFNDDEELVGDGYRYIHYKIPLSGIIPSAIKVEKRPSVQDRYNQYGRSDLSGPFNYFSYRLSIEVKNGETKFARLYAIKPWSNADWYPTRTAVEYNGKYYWRERSIEEAYKECVDEYASAERKEWCRHTFPSEKDKTANIEIFTDNGNEARELKQAFKALVEHYQDNNGNQSTGQPPAKCYEWVVLGEFNIGKWINGNGQETGSLPVGSDRKFYNRDELETDYKDYHSNCKSSAESALDNAIKAMVLVGRHTGDIEDERKRLKAFYQGNLDKCQAHFKRLWEKYEGKFCE